MAVWWNRVAVRGAGTIRSVRRRGGSALLWGEAIADETDDALAARTVHDLFVAHEKGRAASLLARHSGLFAWAFFANSGEVRVGGDMLGMFPIHFFQQGEHFGFSTSLRPLACHPAYNRAIDPVGLMRCLIENGGVGSRSLQQSGRRLPICSALFYDSISRRLEVRQLDLPRLPADKVEDAEQGIARTIDGSRRAVHRLMRRKPDQLLLSGGLDSRHVLALAYECGARPACLTAGRPGDFEALFARAVARKLKLEWHQSDDRVDTLEEDVRDEIRLSALAGGFSSVTMNGLSHMPDSYGHRWAGGLILDGHFKPTEDDVAAGELQSFDYLFTHWINPFGVEIPMLKRFCRDNDQREALAEALREIRNEWEQCAFSGHDRLWWSLMRGRVRHHLGGHAWKGAFRAWPVLPGLDVRFFESVRGLGNGLFEGRRMQREAFARISPSLAKIPLDSLIDRPQAIRPSLVWKLRMRGLRKARRNMTPLEMAERHRYVRCLNLDFPAWLEIRRLAEPHRNSLRQLFDPGVVDEVLLPRDAPYSPSDSIVSRQGGLRLLYGLMMWLGDDGG